MDGLGTSLTASAYRSVPANEQRDRCLRTSRPSRNYSFCELSGQCAPILFHPSCFSMLTRLERFFPVRGTTWGIKGSKQVDVENIDDKRQFTVTPTVSATGKIAGPVQVVWQGKTKASCPIDSVQKKVETELSHAYSPSHWSTADTVLELVSNLWINHVKPTMIRNSWDPACQKWILLWDVYCTHRDAKVIEFLT